MIGNRPGRRTRAGWLTVISVPGLAVIAAATWLVVPLAPKAGAPARATAQAGRPGKAPPAPVRTVSLSAAPRSAAGYGAGIALSARIRNAWWTQP